jgi:exonuclease SbcC
LSTGWQNVISQIIETRDKISNCTQIINNKETDYTQQTTSLTNALEAKGFTSVNQLKSVLLSDADYELYKQQEVEINNSGVALKTEQDINKQAIAAENEKDDHSLTLTEVESRISNASAERDNISKQLGGLSNILQTDEANKTKVQATLNELDKIKEELGYYDIINKLIGDEKGNTFNNIVQRLTLRYLFKMTNVRLNTLMDRFQVELGSEGQLDEIWVIDTYMGDERRTINSVAGGERFVISLAMALSLSDMASSNIKIDSLFIDEGFGSLSPDELDNTISMLERMQLENEKTVGIISHVESLKERINPQIVVERLQNGESTLFLKSNGERTKLRV